MEASDIKDEPGSPTRKHARESSSPEDFISLDVNGDIADLPRKRQKHDESADGIQINVASTDAVDAPEATPTAEQDDSAMVDLAPETKPEDSEPAAETRRAKKGKTKAEKKKANQEKAKSSDDVLYQPKSATKKPMYKNATGRFDLSEVLDSQGQSISIKELSYPIFTAHFLRVNRNKLGSLKARTCAKAFSSYVQNYYQHTPTKVRKQLLDGSKSSLNVFESIRDALIAEEPADRRQVTAPLNLNDTQPTDDAHGDGGEPKLVQPESSKIDSETVAAPVGEGTEPAPVPQPELITEETEMEDKPTGNGADEGECSEAPGLTVDEASDLDETIDEAYKAEVLKYYPEPDGVFVLRCLRCGQGGHQPAACPTHTCSACGEKNAHPTYACPTRRPCAKCREVGHAKDHCPEKLSVPRSDAHCAICLAADHLETACHQRWRSYVPPQPIIKVQSLPADCFYCGKRGHLGPECGLLTAPVDAACHSWTRANWELYVDPASDVVYPAALPQVSSAATRPPMRGPKAITHPADTASHDDEPFLRPRVQAAAPSGPRGSIRVSASLPPRPPSPRHSSSAGRRNPPPGYRPPPPGPGAHHPPPFPRGPGPDRYESGRRGRERSFSPPPFAPQGLGSGYTARGGRGGPPPGPRGRGRGRGGGRGGRR